MTRHNPHHGNYIEGHEIQPAPVTCHRSNSFLSKNKHNSSLTAPPTDQHHLHNSERSTGSKYFDLTMVMYQLLTTVSSNRVTAEKQDISSGKTQNAKRKNMFKRFDPVERKNNLVDPH